MIVDIILSIVATLVFGIAIFRNQEKIEKWQKINQGKKLDWRD